MTKQMLLTRVGVEGLYIENESNILKILAEGRQKTNRWRQSHFNERVLAQCEENDVAFVCVVLHSEHIYQPQDVFF